jgi:aspartate/methionine/tyrosine aminotransferase
MNPALGIKPVNPDFTDLPYMAYSEMDIQIESAGIMMNWCDPFRSASRVPAHVIDAVKKALDDGKTQYTVPIGSLALREAIAKRLQCFNGITADPSTEIIVTPGSDAGLYHAMSVIIEPGDEVLIPEPGYSNNVKNTGICGGTPVLFSLSPAGSYQIDKAALREKVAERTKLIVLTNPNNPTGTIFDPDSLNAVREVALEYGLYVVVDQAFEANVFDGRSFVSVATLPDMWERTITVCSTSKAMGMTGFRVGYNVACKTIMQVMHNSAVLVLGATNTFAQEGARAALEDSHFVSEFNAVYDRRRRALHRALNEVPGVRMDLPEAGFMAWVDVSALGSGRDVARYIRETEDVLVNAGDGYGPSAAGFIRICYGAIGEEPEFNDCVQRLRAALTRLSGRDGKPPESVRPA